MMTEADLKAFLEENKADIQAEVKRRFIEKILADYSWDISSQIKQVVGEFTKNHLIPEVEKELEAQRGPLVAAAIAGIAGICDSLGKGLASDAAKCLSDDYKRRQVLKSIFGNY